MPDDIATVPAKPANVPDVYQWRAIYDDGTMLDEYGEDAPDGRGFSQIDLDRLRYFVLVPSDDKREHVIIDIREDFRPIFYRRRFNMANANALLTEEGVSAEYVGSVYVLGLQTTANGKNVAIYTFVFENGQVLISDNYQAV